MQLLHSRAGPSAEFASLSLLYKGDISGDQISCRMGEPLLLPSPCTTFSTSMCVDSLRELHFHVNSVLKASRSNKVDQDKLVGSISSEGEKLLNDLQVFRPVNGFGIGLHYRIIRDRGLISQLIPVVCSASKSTVASDRKGFEANITGVVVCVGFAGIPYAMSISSLHYSLGQRIQDCLHILGQTGTADTLSSRTVLSTLLMIEEEERLYNSMAAGSSRTLLSEVEDSGDHKIGGKLLGKKKGKSSSGPGEEIDQGADYSINSSEAARNMVERFAVLSVAESDTLFRKYEGKANESERAAKSRRGKKGRDADLDGFDFKGETRLSQRTSNTPATKRSAGSAPPIPSSAASKSPSTGKGLQLRQPRKDTARTKRQSSVPALTASSKDQSRSRRGSVESSIAGSRPNRGGRRGASGSDDANNMLAFDTNNNSGRGIMADEASQNSGRTPASGSVGSRSAKAKQNFDPFSGQSETTQTATSESTSSREQEYSFSQTGAFGSDFGHSGSRSSRSLGADSLSNNGPRLLVNLALNEDLTCFYKLSKMSSCSVEGVLQVQVKSNMQQAAPFSLQIRDPSGHIESLQENKKFAESTTGASPRDMNNSRPDYQFTVSVPSTDNYFPVMRYRCSNDLRPVPIVSSQDEFVSR